MAILKIARMGHPVLLQVAKPVETPTSPAIRRLVGDMVETMIDAGGAGLAAPQVHVPLRVVIFQAPPERADVDATMSEAEAGMHSTPLTVLINPEIEVLGEETDEGWEGCLSVPGLTGLVLRANHIIYRGATLSGETLEREARGFHARVVQHECDHLDGILYPQRMTDLSNLMFESEMRHYGEAEGEDDDEDEAL